MTVYIHLITTSQSKLSPMAQQPLVGLGLVIIGASRSHSDTPQTVGLLSTSDQRVTDPLSDNTQQSQKTDIHAGGGIRTHNPSKRAAALGRAATVIGSQSKYCL
jgi:ribosomal protein L30/L7E